MGQAGFEGNDESGRWGSGLLWPAVRAVLVLALAVAVLHWGLARGTSEAPPAPALDVAVTATGGPSQSGASDGGELTVRADRNGHFLVTAVINGENMPLLVDTGASNLVLSGADAAKLGIDLHNLTYSERYETANGIALGAPVTLREFRVGSFSLHDVRATVMASSMPVSLLGMSVLSRFSEHEMRGDKLILRW